MRAAALLLCWGLAHALPWRSGDGGQATTRPGAELGEVRSRNSTKAPFAVTFVNGIYHSIQDWKDITRDIQSLFGVVIKPFYNPSSGWWVTDATRAGVNLVLRPSDLELARGLADHLRSALKDVEPNGRVLHIAHSGGAILTYLAAKHHLTLHEKTRIDVITLGGGKSITRKYFPGRVLNYYSRNDPLTLLDNRAGRLLRRANNHSYAEIRDTKHNTTFVFLAAQAQHPMVDHSMLGPTYRHALRLEAKAFKARLQQILTSHNQKWSRLRHLRKKVAHLTGAHHFWSWYVLPKAGNWLRRARKFSAKTTGWHGHFSGKRSVTTRIDVNGAEVRCSAPVTSPTFANEDSLEAFEFLHSR